MLLSTKIAIGSCITFLVILVFGWAAFPALLRSKIKSSVSLKKGNDIREMWIKVPFPLDFKVYIFNVTNALDVHNGDSPVVDEIGPYFFDEWKSKVDLVDNETDDTVSFNPVSRFVFNQKMSGKLTMDEKITLPHPLMTAMVISVARDKPAMLSLLDKAITEIFHNPQTMFVTVTVRELLFDGIRVDCDVKSFGAKAVCTQLKTEAKDLEHIDEHTLAFSFFGMKNKTIEGRFKVKRGIRNSKDLGRVIEYEGKEKQTIWSGDECNNYHGTDSTIFPPFLGPGDGVWSFAPDLCRSLGAFRVGSTIYNNIPVDEYRANFGDMSQNEAEKCFCPTPTTCLKRGAMDLMKCVGGPMVASLPHFLDADESYVKGVRGLHPKEEDHAIILLFERTTGSTLFGRKRLQFSIALQKVPKIAFLKDIPETFLPMLWVEEGVALNSTWTHSLETSLFRVLTIFDIIKWMILSLSLIGMIVAVGLRFYKRNNFTVTPTLGKIVPTVLNPNKIFVNNNNTITGERNDENT